MPNASKPNKPGRAAVPPRHLDLKLQDASEHSLHQSWLPTEFCQLSRGDYVGSFQELDTGRQRVVRESQSQLVHKQGLMSHGHCTISFHRQTAPLARFCEYQIPANGLIFYLPAGSEFDVQVPAGFEIMYVRFDQQQLLEAQQAFGTPNLTANPDRIGVFKSPGQKRLDAFLNALFDVIPAALVRQYAPDADQISQIVTDSVLLALDQADPLPIEHSIDFRARHRARHMVRHSREFLEDSLKRGHCPSMVEICKHLGISQRSLQYGFRDLMGMTPVAYLRTLRLNRVRADLRQPDSNLTVTEAATRWSFFHLSKFAHDYRQMFGETPSETLALANR